MARPKIEITKELCAEAERLASRGLSRDEIAKCLGMGARTLYEKMAKYPQLLQAIQIGAARGVEQVSNALFKCALNGSVRAQEFYLRNRNPQRWTDTRKVDFAVEDKRPLREHSVAELESQLDTLLNGKEERITH